VKKPAREHVIAVAVCVGVLLALTTLVCGMLVGWRHLPGLWGEWVGFMVGVMTTPFLMESTFALIGLAIVIFINQWRMSQSGDELMYLEQVDDAEGLPEHAAWALFRDPLTGETPPLLTQAEGALAIGDHQTAAECIAAMPDDQLSRPDVLALRLELAQATGRTELAARLASELHKPAP
jgi:uncharacterized membrane protein